MPPAPSSATAALVPAGVAATPSTPGTPAPPSPSTPMPLPPLLPDEPTAPPPAPSHAARHWFRVLYTQAGSQKVVNVGPAVGRRLRSDDIVVSAHAEVGFGESGVG
eukprot:4988742-Alexandrium_andersonii.AAC.1